MLAVRSAFVICLGLAISSCANSEATLEGPEPVNSSSPAVAKSKTSLSEIDISKIGHITSKGRVQDKDYNRLDVVDQLIANGKDSIPFLINKLDDTTVIHNHVMDYWPKITVGDVALIVLTDFSTDSTWTKETIPGTSWDELFESKPDRDTPGWEYLDKQISKHGRPWLQAKWQKIWTNYKDRIVWDEKERSFKVV